MQHVDTLLHARWIIPIEPANALYENYTLVMDAGKILDCLPTAEAKTRYQSDDVLNMTTHALLAGRLVLPARQFPLEQVSERRPFPADGPERP